MLILDISVNENKIDTIGIKRIKSTRAGNNTYRIVKPKGYEKRLIKHHYDEGYFSLVRKVVEVLFDYNPKPQYTWKEIRDRLG
jgi:hypothetical protein